ncbi:hypothetical protein K439DRAFT_1615631 [Ramaria rubella]|nr:hypothetical protein K439DRAFT_1615631 [Ramaria rubella]
MNITTWKEGADWQPRDDLALINLLIEHKGEAGDGGNFSKTTWMAVSSIMVTCPHKRGLKTWEACKSRWVRLKKDYGVALSLKQNLSGITFLDHQGVVIEDASVWKDLCSLSLLCRKIMMSFGLGRQGFLSLSS